MRAPPRSAIIFDACVTLVVAHAAEDSGIGFEPGQLADAGVQRVAAAARSGRQSPRPGSAQFE